MKIQGCYKNVDNSGRKSSVNLSPSNSIYFDAKVK